MRITALVVCVWLALTPVPESWAAPKDLITQCSKTDYRQAHLAQCNQQPAPGIGVGGGGGGSGGGGLLGGLLGGLGGLL